jgi:hypothetical protein
MVQLITMEFVLVILDMLEKHVNTVRLLHVTTMELHLMMELVFVMLNIKVQIANPVMMDITGNIVNTVTLLHVTGTGLHNIMELVNVILVILVIVCIDIMVQTFIPAQVKLKFLFEINE